MTDKESMMRNNVTKIHMIGIGGAGMSGIAEVLLNLGYAVSGSDVADGIVVRRLRGLGAEIHIGHAAENVGAVNVVVKSSAVRDDNPEIVAAREHGIPVIPRAEMLAELMRLRTGIAIAGTHGKTSTTSLTAAIFDAARLDPTVIIGGRINAYGANARLGQGKYLIAEADESDGSFLCLLPIINVVTNVDQDHLDHYGTQEAIDDAFVSFMNQVPFYGLNVVCGDDPGVQRLLSRVKRPVVTYGFGSENHIRAEVLECGVINRFRVFIRGKELGEVRLAQPGPPSGSQLAGRHRGGAGRGHFTPVLHRRVGPFRRRGAAFRVQGREKRDPGGRRLWAPSRGNRRHSGHRPHGVSRPAHRGGFPAASFFPYSGPFRRILSGFGHGGQAVADGDLSCVREAYPRRYRTESRTGNPSGFQS